MKRILFIVGTHGNELAPLQLFYQYPYGRTENTEWEVVVANPDACLLNVRCINHDLNRIFGQPPQRGNEALRARMLKKKILDGKFDVVYDVHTSTEYKPKTWQHCAFINIKNTLNLSALEPLQMKHIIWDNDPKYNTQYTTSCHPVGITLEYQKFTDIGKTTDDILCDFDNIVQNVRNKTKRILYTADTPVTHEDRLKYKLTFEDFRPLTVIEKNQLSLSSKERYVPVFTDIEFHQEYYCFLNKKV